MKWLAKRISPVSRGEGGFTLIESLVAVAILGAIGVVFMVAMNTAYGSVGTTDERSQAEALIRTQLDDIKAATYRLDGVYPVTVSVPNQYSVTITVETLDEIGRSSTCEADSNCNTLQDITVAVTRPEDGGDRTILSVSSYKVREWE